MIKFSRHILLVFSFFALTFLSAEAQSSPAAIDMLNKAAAAYEQNQGIAASFKIESYDESQDLLAEIDGNICLKASRFMLEVPDEMKAWFDGHDLWTLLLDAQEVNLSTPSEEELLMLNPVNIFMLYQQGYACRMLNDKKNGQQIWSGIELIAPNASSEIQRVSIYFDKQHWHPKQINLYQKQQHTIITITQYQTNQHFADSYFLFPQRDYPMVEVIDLR